MKNEPTINELATAVVAARAEVEVRIEDMRKASLANSQARNALSQAQAEFEKAKQAFDKAVELPRG